MTGPRPPLTPGVYRMADAAAALHALSAAGWDARPVAPARSAAELYRALAVALALPAWFGANLDALWDVVAELRGPTALVLTGWPGFERAEPATAARVVELFAERARTDPPFVAVLATGPVRTDGGWRPRPGR